MICSLSRLSFPSHEKKPSPERNRILHRGGNSSYFLQGDFIQVTCVFVCTCCALHYLYMPLTSVLCLRIFRRKSGHRNGNHHTNFVAENTEHDQDVIETSEMLTPNTQIHLTSMAETQTKRNTGKNCLICNHCSLYEKD